ncbi:MAG: SpoIVB peptidase [Oscillospiraceae bacterium]|jgi:stage IV sporulation protein B|nr:SpoIVB peptidase [Oscillospiraceae bacterium]
MRGILKRETWRPGVFAAAVLLAMSVSATPAQAQGTGKTLVPMGCTVGIEMHTPGVMTAGLASTSGGAPSPAALAGVLPGDLITEIGGTSIEGVKDFQSAIESLSGETTVTVRRGEQTMKLAITPDYSSGRAELGLWLRDSISGIGTLTYYDPETGRFGGLGHAICDVDTGIIVPLGSGCILESSVVGVVKGIEGTPGELRGSFDINNQRGTIESNTGHGIFGVLDVGTPDADEALPVASEDEIELGKATVRSNITGQVVEEFELEIVRVYHDDYSGRTMMLKITDPRLLELTGGIVQGMSGSPIIQNGRLVGAVTHVMLADPTSGYGVSAEKMLTESAAS